jgi:hypothetical protein
MPQTNKVLPDDAVVESEEQPQSEQQVKQEYETEEYIEEEGDGEIQDDDGVGETVVKTVSTTVAEDGTRIVTTKTTRRIVTEEKGSKVAVCCVIL